MLVARLSKKAMSMVSTKGFGERTASSEIQRDEECEACQKGKLKTTSHQTKTCEDILHGYSVESTTYRAFVVDQQKVIDSPSVQFNNSMLQAVKGEIDGIDDSYPSSGMTVYNTTHYFNEASQQGKQYLTDSTSDKRLEDITTYQAPDAYYIWNWTLVDVYKCNPGWFQVDPRESNLIASNKIIRYLKGLPILGVKYPKDIVLNMFGYIDIDYACCKKDMRSISEAVNLSDRRSIS
ncbi:hypothetical protein AgCh_003459 [Apium graveolens]